MAASITELFPALVECFTIILCGYISGRANIITPNQGQGLGKFVGNFALPALLFKNMVELDFDTVSWFFMVAVLLAKATVFAMVFLLSIALLKSNRLSRGSLYAIFTTQSNDFALGYPLVTALYSSDHPEFIQYIYLLAPISLLILNPIGFMLLEIEKNNNAKRQDYMIIQDESSDDGKVYLGESIAVIDADDQDDLEDSEQAEKRGFDARACASVLKGVLLNPLVFMVFIGLAGHFIFGGKLPPIISDTLSTLSNAFAGAALFFLGHTMVGKISNQKGMELLLPVLLIIAKIVVLPVIIHQYCGLLANVMSVSYPPHIDPGSLNGSSYITALSDFGYLYGTFPSAPTVVIYATQYGLEADRLAAGMVICTTLSAPVMYISAWTLSMANMSAQYFDDQVVKVEKDASIVTLLCATWCIIIFIVGGKFKRVPHAVTLAYMFSLVLSSLGNIVWDSFADTTGVTGKLILFAMMFFGVKCSRLYVASIALVLVMIIRKGQRAVWNSCFIFIFVPVVLAFIVTVSLMTSTAVQSDGIEGIFIYGRAQDTVSLVVLVLCFLIVISCLIAIAKLQEDHDSELSPSSSLLDRSSISPSSCDESPIRDRQTLACCLRTRCVSGDVQKARHIVFLVVSTISIFLGICLVTWRLFQSADAGVYFEVAFLDAVFNFGQGLFVFLLFGLDPDLIVDPFVRLYRKLRYGSESISLPELSVVDKTVLLQCLQFIRHHMDDCKLDIVDSHRQGLVVYENAFTGTVFCDWIIDRGLVGDRSEAEIYGHKLLVGRVMHHVTHRHYFYDRPYLYMLEEPKTCHRVLKKTDCVSPSTLNTNENKVFEGDVVISPSRNVLNVSRINAPSPRNQSYFGFSFEAYVSDTEALPSSLRRSRIRRDTPRSAPQTSVETSNSSKAKSKGKKIFPTTFTRAEYSDSSAD